MPVRPERRALYPKDWKALSLSTRQRAGWRCEGSPGVYPDCRAANGMPHPVTGSKVVLTVAHLDHDETSADPANLMAMCQRCHLTNDRQHHAKNAAASRRRRSPQLDLVEALS